MSKKQAGAPIVRGGNIVRYFGDVEAVKGISFDVESGGDSAFLFPMGPARARPLKFCVPCCVPLRAERRSSATAFYRLRAQSAHFSRPYRRSARSLSASPMGLFVLLLFARPVPVATERFGED